MNKLAYFMRESGLARFLIPAGIALIVFGIVFLVVNTQNRNYVKTEATVVKSDIEEEAHIDENDNEVDATYILTIEYTVGGEKYISELDGMREHVQGDKIDIYYDPDDPGSITQTKSLIIPIAIIAAGIAALIGGIASGVNAIKKYKKMKQQEKEWANGQ